MSREIKFRFWKGGSHGGMFYGDLYSFEQEGIREWPGTSHTGIDAVMQYTGLKDANGAEIYEGDVVRYTPDYGDGPEELVAEVKWLESDACFITERDNEFDHSLSYAVRNGAVIGGNAYEHPHLLMPIERN